MRRRPDSLDLGMVGAAFVFSVVTIDPGDAFWITLAFTTAVLSALALLVRLGVHTGLATMRQRRLVRDLGDVDPTVVARQAVLVERARLSSELDACIREALREVTREVGSLTSDEDPRSRARRIHAHAREATSELRRQLGLLRSEESDRQQTGAEAPGRPAHPDRRDLLLGGVSGLLAALEAWALGQSGVVPDMSAWGVLLTGLAGLTLVGRRTHAPVAALACASLIAVGWALPHQQVSSGAWMMWTLGGLAWALAAVRPRPSTLAAALLLGGVAGASRLREDPENAGIILVTLGVAWVLGTVVGWNRRRHLVASSQADELRATLDAARERAVHDERISIARELHDVVSHAVGVIATQAAAAEVSWPAHPHTALRALDTIAASAERALAELDRVMPGKAHDDAPYDVSELVARIRAAGTRVTHRREGTVPPGLEPVVYRIVQEGLTNAVRHAPGAAIHVRVAADPTRVLVAVSDEGAAPSGTGSGFGLVGLEERVALVGGRLRAGPVAGGGFALEAELPVRTESSA